MNWVACALGIGMGVIAVIGRGAYTFLFYTYLLQYQRFILRKFAVGRETANRSSVLRFAAFPPPFFLQISKM
jgi:hypothetical protein